MTYSDYASWVGALATSGGLIFAFIQLAIDRKSAIRKL